MGKLRAIQRRARIASKGVFFKGSSQVVQSLFRLRKIIHY